MVIQDEYQSILEYYIEFTWYGELPTILIVLPITTAIGDNFDD